MTHGQARGGPRPGLIAAAVLCGASLSTTETAAAVSDHSKNWDVELLGTVRDCDDCEPRFELRATGPYGETETFGVPAGGARAVDAVHVSGSRAVIVQSFAGRFLHRVVLYALTGQPYTRSWSGFPAADVLAAEVSVSPDGRYVLFRPARAPGEPLDPRLFLWDTVTRMPSAPWGRRTDCGGPEAPCPPDPDLHVLLFPRPPAPDAEDDGDPLPYPLHAVWVRRVADDPNVVRSAEDRLALRHMFLDRLAFVALDRREWLTLVLVTLEGADSAIDCHLPIMPYRRDGLPGASTEEVRSVELGPNGAVVEMYGNAGVKTVHTVPVGGSRCRRAREHWDEARGAQPD